MTREVIMPALGIMQETGVIVAWHKAVGDPVATGDVLLEVETDKAVMEIEAQADGFLTGLSASAGDEVPVGQQIAFIGETPDADAAPSPASPATSDAPAVQDEPKAPGKPEMAVSDATAKTEQPRSAIRAEGRVLASPKARRLAAQRGLDLELMVASGQPQPIHAADLDQLAAAQSGSVAHGMRERTRIHSTVIDEFLAMAAAETGQSSSSVFAAFASGALRSATGQESVVVAVTVAGSGKAATFVNADRCGLGSLKPAEHRLPADLILQDLTAGQMTQAEPGSAGPPVLSVARKAGRFEASLVAGRRHVDEDWPLACLDEFASRLEEPLRHLL